MMKDYGRFYASLTQSCREQGQAISQLNNFLTSLVYGAYLMGLIWRTLQVGLGSWPILVCPGLGFVGVSLLRRLINRPRPYEGEGILPLVHKETVGQSFPSRHVFSAAVIGTSLLVVSPWLGGLVLGIALLLAVLRVVGGVHYPSDVAVGFLLGVLCGLPVLFL